MTDERATRHRRAMGEQATLLDHADTPEVRRASQADFSPPGLVVDLVIALDRFLIAPPRAILGPCAGPGVFGQVEAELWPSTRRYGAELRPTETGGGHYDRYRAGVRAEQVIRDRGLDEAGDLEVDAVIDNPAFTLAYERHDGKGKKKRPRPCLLDLIREHMPDVRLVALLGRTQWGERGDGRAILADHRPALQLRATAPAACRGGSKTDSDDYSLWCWGDREIFRLGPSAEDLRASASRLRALAELCGMGEEAMGEAADLMDRTVDESVGWTCVNVPALSTSGACYRWEGGRPGDVPLSNALVERLHEARASRAGRRS